MFIVELLDLSLYLFWVLYLFFFFLVKVDFVICCDKENKEIKRKGRGRGNEGSRGKWEEKDW